MKTKSIIILSSVAALCTMGLMASQHIDWSVNYSDASGDIAKSERFSLRQSVEKLTNIEELIQNDSAYKDGIVTAYVVMQTRAIQFGSLVDMSNEVAGDIPEFAEVLNDMNEARKTVTNVNNALTQAGEDLNAALNGEERPDLTQNTINASLAYTTLQRQNKLANHFIEITDKYLETAEGDDRLKFVRDQWVDYQTMTAAFEGNDERAEELVKKGNLLPADKSLAALETFKVADQVAVIQSCNLSQELNISTRWTSVIPPEKMNAMADEILKDVSAMQKEGNDLVMAINTMYNASEVMRAYNHFTNNLSNVIKQNQTAIYRVPCLMTEIISSTAEGNKLSFL